MSEKGLPSLLDRHWAESALAIGAIVIAAVSLWVAYDTELTNRELVASQRQLVAASSWPFVQVTESDVGPSGAPDSGVTLVLANQGVGPAKLESFALFWKGQPQHSIADLLTHCCGIPAAEAASAGVEFSSTHGIVLRQGQSLNFLVFPLEPRNQALLSALRAGLDNFSFHYCYCSAFDQCWLVKNQFGQAHELSPPQVRVCPQPQVSWR